MNTLGLLARLLICPSRGFVMPFITTEIISIAPLTFSNEVEQ